MKKKKATSKSSPNQQSHHNSRHAQRARILAELTEAGGRGCTTIRMREIIDVLHPAGRILELREEGHIIHTWLDVTENAQDYKHRNARDVLMRHCKEAVA